MKSIVEDFDHIALRLTQIEQEKSAAKSEDKVEESPIVVGELIWTAGDFDCFG